MPASSLGGTPNLSLATARRLPIELPRICASCYPTERTGGQNSPALPGQLSVGLTTERGQSTSGTTLRDGAPFPRSAQARSRRRGLDVDSRFSASRSGQTRQLQVLSSPGRPARALAHHNLGHQRDELLVVARSPPDGSSIAPPISGEGHDRCSRQPPQGARAPRGGTPAIAQQRRSRRRALSGRGGSGGACRPSPSAWPTTGAGERWLRFRGQPRTQARIGVHRSDARRAHRRSTRPSPPAPAPPLQAPDPARRRRSLPRRGPRARGTPAAPWRPDQPSAAPHAACSMSAGSSPAGIDATYRSLCSRRRCAPASPRQHAIHIPGRPPRSPQPLSCSGVIAVPIPATTPPRSPPGGRRGASGGLRHRPPPLRIADRARSIRRACGSAVQLALRRVQMPASSPASVALRTLHAAPRVPPGT
jgi:hypothetical protein